jgi:signal transduction histidine kinase
MTGYRTRTILCLPVRNYRGELIGVIETLNKKNGLFDEADERLLSIVSFLFAAAIENAQLYHAIRQQIRENKSLEASKIQAERLAMVGQMASSIIHDIRSPLAIIRGYAELTVAGSVSTEKRQRFANTITEEVRRLRDMAQELQEFSEGAQAVQPVPTPLGEVVEEVIAFLEGNFRERGIHIIHHLQYTGALMLDAPRIKRVLHNLAMNAADAMSGGGTFMITSSRLGEYVHLEVHDTGSGIPEEIRSRIFEPFVTYGKPHGTGLGLAVVKRIVEEHHGDITVATSATGTTFTIRLPFMPALPETPSHRIETKAASS